MTSGIFAQGTAETASPKPTAVKFAEFGPISSAELAKQLVRLRERLKAEQKSQGYIINYGTAKAIRARRTRVLESISWRDCDPSRIIFVDGPPEPKVRTVLWIMPAGAEYPAP